MKRPLILLLFAVVTAGACDRSGGNAVPADGALPIIDPDDTLPVQPDTQRVPPR